MLLLLISLTALVVGPLVYRVADSARSSLVALDGFVMVAVTGLVLVHIIPHSLEAAGVWALVPALIGFLGPGMVEHTLRNAARQAHATALVLALAGLMVHGFFDGAALASPRALGESVSVLAIAVALHRLPVAITIWSLLSPNGRGLATGVLVGLGVATVAGYALVDTVLPFAEASWLGHFQALIAGSLLHVVIHRPSLAQAETSLQRIYAGTGGLVAVVLVAGLSHTHIVPAEQALGFGETFMALALETAPALLIAFALAGVVQVFLPQATMRWMRTGRASSESVRGVAFGLPLPICSCGVIPLYRTLIGQGVPATAAMAFLVATPELGLDAILISLPLLGADLTIARVVCAAIVALLAGWLVGRLAQRREAVLPAVAPAATRGNLVARLRAGLRFGFGEIVDHTGPWLLLGLAIAALAAPLLRGEWLAALPPGVDVMIFALIGMPMYVCASGATPLAAVLIFKGVSPGAAIAFLLAGPATNITTFGVLRDLHGPRIAALFAALIAGLSIGLGLLVNVVLGNAAGMALGQAVHEDASVIEIAALAALAVVFAVSVLRQGPRRLVEQIIAPYGSGGHDHDHDHHGHDHDHDPPAKATRAAGADCC